MNNLSRVLIIMLITLPLFAQIPQTLSYQGILTDAEGNAISDGNHTLTFNLYAEMSGGTPLWSETITLQTIKGLFSTILGKITPLNLPFDQTYFLGISIDDETEMSPRVELTSSAYAFKANSIADLSVSSSKIQDGQLVRSINELTDDVVLSAGNNISITKNGNVLTIDGATPATGGVTLDQAYDYGGPGVGRSITALDGAFEVNGLDGVLFTGSRGSGSLPASGAGIRAMWYPNKAAFRAGVVDGTQWDDTNIGHNSIAFGSSTISSGNSTTALGFKTTASGYYSTAIGEESNANGQASFASGYGAAASAQYSTAMGYQPTASGDFSLALGHSTNAIGSYAIASGFSTTASGRFSIARGRETTASGDFSQVFGYGMTVSGDYSVGIGLDQALETTLFQNNTMAIMGGNVGIGTLSPLYPLSIVSDGANRSFYINHDQTGLSNSYGIYVDLDNTYTGNTLSYGIYSNTLNDGGGSSTFGVAGTATGTSTGPKYGIYGFSGGSGTGYAVYASGDLGYTGTLIGVSDQKLKTNEKELSGVLSRLKKVRPKSYNYKRNEYKNMNLAQGTSYGVVAQEIEQIFPELVVDAVHPGEFDKEGNQITDAVHYKGVKYVEMIPVLLQAIKELTARVEELEAR